jgi:hypothetical protein
MAVNTATTMARKVVMVLMAQLLVVVTAGLLPVRIRCCSAVARLQAGTWSRAGERHHVGRATGLMAGSTTEDADAGLA